MKNLGLRGIALYPGLRNYPAPSASRIFEIFSSLQRHQVMSDDEIVKTFEPKLSPVQQQVLELLHVPTTVYRSARAK